MIDFLKIRSMLFVPGDNVRMLGRARRSEADALILDLEDAISLERKDEARRLCKEFLGEERTQPTFIRVNAVSDQSMFNDLAAIVQSRPDGIMLPKCTGPDDLRVLDLVLTALEVREGLPRGEIAVLPIAIEVAQAIFGLGGYRGVTARLCGLMWGVEDIAVDIGSAVRDSESRYLPGIELARSLCVYAAAAASVPAVDAVYSEFRDLDGLARDVEAARAAGFSVKTAIHPAQLDVINRMLTPDPKAIAWATRVVEAFARMPGRGAVAIDGKMHDRPHLRAATAILARRPAESEGHST